MTDQEQIDALKAQVNCLREAALDAIFSMVGGEAKAKLRDAYDAIPEQCLAEVKAKAIEEALLNTEAIGSNGHDYDYDGAELQKYADMLRGQVTVSDQLDLATKIMTVTI